MRVATFNVLHGRSPTDRRVDVRRLADAVRQIDADVLALQEVDRFLPRSGYADLTAVAAEAMGAVDHRFVAAMSGSPGTSWVAAIGEEPPGSPAYGIALLSRHPVSAWRELRLPELRGRVPWWFRGDRRPRWLREEPRVAVAAEVQLPEGPLTVVTAHLSFIRWWGGHQLRSLVRRVPRAAHPVVLLGDLNMGARAAARLTGYEVLAEAATFPADDPRVQLDHVLADRPLPVRSSGAVELAISDHRALVVDLG